MLQRRLHRLDNGIHRLRQGFGDLALAEDQFLGHAAHQVAASYLHLLAIAFFGRTGSADILLDTFGTGLTHQKIMIAPDIGDNGLIHLVAAHAHGTRINDTAQGQQRHLGGATAHIHYHGSRGFSHRQAGADGRRHRFLDQENLARARGLGRFLNGAALHRRGARRHADDDLRTGETAPFMSHADEVLDHFLGDFEIGDNAVAKGAEGLDGAGRTAQHHFGPVAHGQHLFLALDLGNGDHGRLVKNNPLPLHIDKGIRRTKINGHVCREQPQ